MPFPITVLWCVLAEKYPTSDLTGGCRGRGRYRALPGMSLRPVGSSGQGKLHDFWSLGQLQEMVSCGNIRTQPGLQNKWNS